MSFILIWVWGLFLHGLLKQFNTHTCVFIRKPKKIVAYYAFSSPSLLLLKNYILEIISYTCIERFYCVNGALLISVLFSRSVVSNSLRPHEPQHARPPCPSPTPGVYPNSCPLSQWCHLAISSSVIPFSSCLQSFPTSGSFQMSQLFSSGGQNIGSLSFNISPSNEHRGLISFRMDWLDLLAVQGTLKSLLQHHSSKASILQRSAFFIAQLSHPYMTIGKTKALTRWTLLTM